MVYSYTYIHIYIYTYIYINTHACMHTYHMHMHMRPYYLHSIPSGTSTRAHVHQVHAYMHAAILNPEINIPRFFWRIDILEFFSFFFLNPLWGLIRETNSGGKVYRFQNPEMGNYGIWVSRKLNM